MQLGAHSGWRRHEGPAPLLTARSFLTVSAGPPHPVRIDVTGSTSGPEG